MLFRIAETFHRLPWELEDLTADQIEQAVEWFDLKAKWEHEAYEQAKRDAK